MKFDQLKSIVSNIDKTKRQTEKDELTVVVSVKTIGTIGPSPSVEVKAIYAGFDWDNGKLIIVPQEDLRIVDLDELEVLRREYKELSNSAYTIQRLQQENKRLLKELNDLKSK